MTVRTGNPPLTIVGPTDQVAATVTIKITDGYIVPLDSIRPMADVTIGAFFVLSLGFQRLAMIGRATAQVEGSSPISLQVAVRLKEVLSIVVL